MNIAYIEDDDAQSYVFSCYMKGHNIKTFHTFGEYLKSSFISDVVVSDYSVPDVHIDTLKKAVNKEGCPFILYTGGNISCLGKHNLEFLKEMGVDAFFEKGKDDDELYRFIKRFFQHKENAA